VESEARSLQKVTEQLEARTQALKDQLAQQREEYAQRIFEEQQNTNRVCAARNTCGGGIAADEGQLRSH